MSWIHRPGGSTRWSGCTYDGINGTEAGGLRQTGGGGSDIMMKWSFSSKINTGRGKKVSEDGDHR